MAARTRRDGWQMTVWAIAIAVIVIGAIAAVVVSALNTPDAGIASTPAPTASSDPSSQGAPATWVLMNPGAVDADSTSVELGVVRESCAGGRTGKVLAPMISYEADRILIEVDVEPLVRANYSCIGNDRVPVTVQLTEPIGQRGLIDQACLEDDAPASGSCSTAVRQK